MKIRRSIIILLATNGASVTVANAAIQPLEIITAQAKTFVEQSLGTIPGRHEISPGALDTRLRLPHCTTPLETEFLSLQQRSGNSTVKVSCRSGKPWTIHVPVTVKTFAPVVVTSRPLSRNAPIQNADIRIEEREISPLTSGYYTEVQPLVGKISKRPLAAGVVITPSEMDTQKIIRRGSRVTIIAENESFSIRMEGKALRDAAQGEQIPVENLSSQRKIEAVAVATGTVKVPM